MRAGHARPLQGGDGETGYGGKFRRGEGTPPYARVFKWGRRAASPLAAVVVCGGRKLRAGHARPLQGGDGETGCGGKFRRGEGTPPYAQIFKRGCRAASPLAAVAVCGGGKSRAGHARPPTNGRRVGGNECRGRGLFRKNKKTRRPLPRLVFFKKKEKNRTSRRRLNTNGTTPLQVIPSLRIRQGALVFFLFTFV